VQPRECKKVLDLDPDTQESTPDAGATPMVAGTSTSDAALGDLDAAEPSRDVARGSAKAPIHKALDMFFDKMPTTVSRTFLANFMLMLAAYAPNNVISVGSGCSGTDIGFLAANAVIDFLNHKLGTRVRLEHSFVFELDADKLKHLLDQFEPRYAFRDVSSMKQRKCLDVISNTMVLLPWVFLFFAGFSCTSRTGLSSQASGNLDCVQNGDEETATGHTFACLFAYITRSRPALVILENLSSLLQKATADGLSDWEWIAEQFRKIDYHVHLYQISAEDFGSRSNRLRTYLVAWALRRGLSDEIIQVQPTIGRNEMDFWTTFKEYFTIDRFDPELFIVRDLMELRMVQASALLGGLATMGMRDR
jgi:site-specific DNA-cytosine methylase